MSRIITVITLASLLLAEVSQVHPAAGAEYPPVTTPPESFFELVNQRDRDTARQFYKKCLDVKGMPVAASAEVADVALERTYSIVTHLLAGRSDILEAMVKNRMSFLMAMERTLQLGFLMIYLWAPTPQFQDKPISMYTILEPVP